MKIPEKPLLIFDGDCNFCRHLVVDWKHLTGDQVAYVPYQEVQSSYPEISKEQFDQSVHLILPTGEHFDGSHAVFRVLSTSPGWVWLLWLYRTLPGFAPVSEWVYRQVSENRGKLSMVTRWWWGAGFEPFKYFISRRVFILLLGVTYLIAFLSLGVQVQGLMGEQGILPAGELLEAIKNHSDGFRYFNVPTWFWINSSDAALLGACVLGAVLALLVIFRVALFVPLTLMWSLYLSLMTVGRDFMMFQWDTLLVETGFLALFLVPWKRARPGAEARPSLMVILLMRWELFRLMFFSGAGKWLSGDPAWHNLTALNFHFETQPLPTWIGWHLHHLPEGFLKIGVVCVFLIQTAVPFLIFGPRYFRVWAFFLFVLFQVMVALTGNYGFFNLLTVTLCTLLLEDRHWKGVFQKRWSGWFQSSLKPMSETLSKYIAVLFLVLFVGFMSSIQLAKLMVPGLMFPDAIVGIVSKVEPWRLVNRYGLFTVMTTQRREIVIEGSADGNQWQAYSFQWKPDDVGRAPEFVEPHQPRLDWQMWFAALGDYNNNSWVIRLMGRLLQSSPQVLGLLETNPFPDAPPRYVRAVLYDYHFTDESTREKTGNWWVREKIGLYAPPIQLNTS